MLIPLPHRMETRKHRVKGINTSWTLQFFQESVSSYGCRDGLDLPAPTPTAGWEKRGRASKLMGQKTGKSLTHYCHGQNRLGFQNLKHVITNLGIGNQRRETCKHFGKSPFLPFSQTEHHTSSPDVHVSTALLPQHVTPSPFGEAKGSAGA